MNAMPILFWTLNVTLLCYALAFLFGLIRLFIGPHTYDRVLAADFLYNVAMLLVLLLSIYYANSIYYEITFLMAVLGFVSTFALAKFLIRGEIIE